MYKRFLLHCLLYIGFASAGYAQDVSPPNFHKGINLSSWLANAPRQPLYARDLAQIKRAGFDHVRLPVNPEQFEFSFSPMAKKADFAPVDRAIAMAVKQGLPVILDIHPPGSFMKALENDPSARQPFIELWVLLATRYRKYPASKLAFELLNEPQYYEAEASYNALMCDTLAAIRKIDANRLVIVAAPHGSSIKGLQDMQPLNDAHIAYDFHFYEPYLITEQGAHQGFEDKMLPYFRKLPYPARLADKPAAAYALAAPNPVQAQQELEEYKQAGWDAAHIAARIHLARQWAEVHHARLLCGEFGVLRTHIDPQSRYRWIEDTRNALEAEHIPWDIWDYSDLDGIVTLMGKISTDPADHSVRLVNPAQGARRIEPAALRALGLR